MAHLLTTQETAERMQVSERTVRRLIAAEKLPVVRIGRSVRVDERALSAFVREQSSHRLLPTENEPATPRQRSALHAKARTLDLHSDLLPRTTHDRILRLASDHFGREIESVNDLLLDEASWCLDQLSLEEVAVRA